MLSDDWIDLIRMIPEEQHNKLVFTTMTGIDLNVEVVLRMEPTYMAFRGRVSGQTDDGRVFFLPYRQIDYLQINREVKEAEIRKLYGDMAESAAPRPAAGVFAAAGGESGTFAAVAASLSQHGLIASPASPSAPAPASPSRPSIPGVVARLGTAIGAGPLNNSRLSNGPSPSGESDGADTSDSATPPRNSILERLRAQRNSLAPQRPGGR